MKPVTKFKQFLADNLNKQLKDAGLTGRIKEVVLYSSGDDVFSVVAVSPKNDMRLVQAVGETFAAFRMEFKDSPFETTLLDLNVKADQKKYEDLSSVEDRHVVKIGS